MWRACKYVSKKCQSIYVLKTCISKRISIIEYSEHISNDYSTTINLCSMTLWVSHGPWRQWRPKKRSVLDSFVPAQSSKSLRAATSRILRPDIRGIQFHLRKRKIVTTIQCKWRRNFERLYVNSILIKRTHSTMIRHTNIHDILTLDANSEFSEYSTRLSYNRIVVTVVNRYSDVTHIILSDWSSDHIAITDEQHCFPQISGWLHYVHSTQNAFRIWFSFTRFYDIPMFTTYTNDPRNQNKSDPKYFHNSDQIKDESLSYNISRSWCEIYQKRMNVVSHDP